MGDRTEHRWSIDGIQEGVARIEEDGERMISVPSHLLPDGAKEGQLLRVSRSPGAEKGTVTVTIAIDEAGTTSALRKSKAVMRESMRISKQVDPGGDVSL